MPNDLIIESGYRFGVARVVFFQDFLFFLLVATGCVGKLQQQLQQQHLDSIFGSVFSEYEQFWDGIFCFVSS
jgi:hypothetical protein